MSTTKTRLLEFLSYLDIGQNAFEKKVGISNGYISHIKGSIGSDIINKITYVYPKLNAEWLLTGEGEMLKDVSMNNVNGNGNTSVAGNGNITNANITEMLELQKGYQEMIKTSQVQLSESQSQINRLITIIEQLHHE
ncbi:MAG: helix-turn-helix domain-containing protein [Bacteroidales bacterium]|jgi:hypothetical protein|nr:helix-turn-helix domain-containing protein [Bacteroidales bacterium]